MLILIHMRLTFILFGIFIISTLFAFAILGSQSPIVSYTVAVIATTVVFPMLILIFLLRIPISTPIWKKAASWICFTFIVIGFYGFTYIKALETLKKCDSQNGILVYINRNSPNAPGSLKCVTQNSI